VRVVATTWLLGLALGVGGSARAGTSDSEIDDPKVSRRLGTRIDWPARPTEGPSAAPVPSAPVAPPAPVAAAPVGVEPMTDEAAPRSAFVYTAPRAKLGMRHFSFVRLGASTALDGRAESEAFDSVGIDVYPISSIVRVGLSTQFGWQSASGMLGTSGDYFAAQSLSLGGQWLGNRVVPFAEVFGGVGYMRRLQFDRTIPTAYFQLGVDLGAEVYFARVGFVSVALGYLRPINGFAAQQTFVTAFTDSWSFKVGIGL
jgi:hypothetical protein